MVHDNILIFAERFFMAILLLIPLFAIGLTIMVDYFLPKMARRKRVIFLCIIGLLSLLLGCFLIFILNKAAT